MNALVMHTLAVIVGTSLGLLINIWLIISGSQLIPLPDGVDPMDADGIKDHLHLFNIQHFIVPFLAHAAGTFAGAFAAAIISASYHRTFAIAIAIMFLVGGIAVAFHPGGPSWFITLDLVLAYLPMRWLGWTLSRTP